MRTGMMVGRKRRTLSIAVERCLRKQSELGEDKRTRTIAAQPEIRKELARGK